MNELTSKTISFLRFPLIVMVVLIHVSLLETGGFATGTYPAFELLEHIINGNVMRVRLPMFFFISGFLFFSRADFTGVRFSPPTGFYSGKFRRRIRTLLIPYLFWNAACFAITAVAQFLVGAALMGDDKAVGDYGFADWLNIFWACKNDMPADAPLWFMRDLIVLSLFSPVIFFVVRRLGLFAVALLGLLWIGDFGFDEPAGFTFTGLFFFSFGAYCSIFGKDFIKRVMPLRKPAAIVFFALVAVETILWKTGVEETRLTNVIFCLGVLSGSAAIFAFTAVGIERGMLRPSRFFNGAAFFVFAFHSKPIMFLIRIVLLHLNPINDLTLTASFFAIPAIVIGVALGLYAALKRLAPGFTNFITGGR